jgi:hypothetical protein
MHEMSIISRGNAGTCSHYFAFQVVKLWEIAPEVLKRTGFEELLPLLPLTKGGQNLGTVDDVRNPTPEGLILTHIFLGLPVGRIDTVEAMK